MARAAARTERRLPPLRDARKVAPAGDGPLAEARAARDTAATLRRRRAKAKAARQQRKRNR